MTDFENLIEATQQGNADRVIEILDRESGLCNGKDATGATPLHYAALNGHRQLVQLLVQRGANVNATDDQFGATPTGWAIEYLRELGGYLAIELDDLAYAIQIGDARWLARFLTRFPDLREASAMSGAPFRERARQSGNQEIAALFGSDGTAG